MNPYIFKWGLSWGVTRSSVSTRSSLSWVISHHYLYGLQRCDPGEPACDNIAAMTCFRFTPRTPERDLSWLNTPVESCSGLLPPTRSSLLPVDFCVRSHCSCLFGIDSETSPIPQRSRSEREDKQQVTSFVCFNFVHILSHLLVFTVADMAAESPPINPSSSTYLGWVHGSCRRIPNVPLIGNINNFFCTPQTLRFPHIVPPAQLHPSVVVENTAMLINGKRVRLNCTAG